MPTLGIKLVIGDKPHPGASVTFSAVSDIHRRTTLNRRRGVGVGGVSLQLNIISGPAWGGARGDNNPREVKGEDKDALHHIETHGGPASSASLPHQAGGRLIYENTLRHQSRTPPTVKTPL